jgi:hypothetical protein
MSLGEIVIPECDTTWITALSALGAIELLEDGWDGAGSLAPSGRVVDHAEWFLLKAKLAGSDPPVRAVAGHEGTVVFEWRDHGMYVKVEIWGAEEGEHTIMGMGANPDYRP